MMRVFDWPWMTAVAVVAGIAMVAVVLMSFRRRLERLARFGARDLVVRLVPSAALGRPTWRAARLAGVMLFAFLALAGPRWGREQSIVQGEGIDIVLALDASLSMLATDERPNRLERMKQEVRRLRADSRGDRFALLAFAGRSYILTPLTIDDGALELFLDNLDPSVVGQAGSSLSRTITQGLELLQASRSAGDRALVVMSDGEAFEEEQAILEAARRAQDARVALVMVGFGTQEGSRIPIREGDRVVPKLDENGEVVITRYRPDLLQAAATAAGGTFIDAGESDKATRIRQALQSLQGVGRAFDAGRTATPRYQLFLLPAVLLLLLDLWRIERHGRRAVDPAAATAVALLLIVSGCAPPWSLASRAATQYNLGRYAESARTYREVIDAGDRRPEMLYNLGTAFVSADSLDTALEPLERAAKAEDAELQYRAQFNLGLAHLKRGLAGVEGADSTRRALAAAIETYKRVLLAHPGDLDAKWNYELALRKQQSGGGGGGGGGGDQNESEQSPEPQQREQPAGGLGQQQAEQLLNSAARDERSVQGKKQRDSRPATPPRGKDW
ncbi:MAG TPA: VWA domain-containing protein [Gemmatimonadaceae bacterium]|nr:VWA domain-containing protein [Gemmatimonadaceae bacterium]